MSNSATVYPVTQLALLNTNVVCWEKKALWDFPACYPWHSAVTSWLVDFELTRFLVMHTNLRFIAISSNTGCMPEVWRLRAAYLGSKVTFWRFSFPQKMHFTPKSITNSFRQGCFFFYEYLVESCEFFFHTNPLGNLQCFFFLFHSHPNLVYSCSRCSMNATPFYLVTSLCS